MITENKSRVKKIAGYLFSFLLMGVFLFIAFKGINLAESFSLIMQASILWLLVFIAVWLLSHLVRALRWKIMINSVKPDASLLNLMGATMIGYGVNCVVPRLGELYRGLFLGKWENISRSSMFGTVIVERIIDILMLALSAWVSVLIYEGDLYEIVPWLKSSLIIAFTLMLILILLILFLVKQKKIFNNVIVKLLGKMSERLTRKTVYAFDMLTDGFSTIKSFKGYVATVILSAAIMMLYGLNAYIGFYMLEMEQIKDVTYATGWIFMTLSAFGIVIPTPGGLGSYHAIAIFVLINLFGFHSEISAAYALLTHFISYAGFILFTVIFLYIINHLQVKKGGAKENFISVLKPNFEKNEN